MRRGMATAEILAENLWDIHSEGGNRLWYGRMLVDESAIYQIKQSALNGVACSLYYMD